MRRLSIIGLAAAVLIAVLALGAGRSDVVRANSDTIPAGYDLLETGDPTALDFLTMPVPTGFFGPGSDPFDGIIAMEGVPIDSFDPDDDPDLGPVDGLGPTSTIVQRPEHAGGFPDTVPIEIVALSLKSVAPITVTYNGGQNPEQWDVTAAVPENDPNQVPGEITISHGAGDGGTFDALLPVKPILTFTQVDPPNTVAVLDWHSAGLDPLEFLATGEDWCHAANPLHNPWDHIVIEKEVLTSNFFPGVTCAPDRNVRDKALFTLDATMAVHSVQPAELPAPHHECYVISDAPPGVSVHLETQFGKEDVEVGPASLLCPPVLKTVLPQGDPEGDLTATHLKCYDIVGQDPQHIVDLETQFGLEEDVAVGPAQRLCVPVVKLPIEPPGPPSGDLLPVPHYECFQISGPPPGVDVLLENQFTQGPEGPITVGPASFLCAPALKTILPDGQPEGDLDAPHLKCYDILTPDVGWMVQLLTQFGIEGEQVPLHVGPGQMLCVPALKTLKYVGGIADFPDDEASPLSASDSSGGPSWLYAAVAGGLAALVLLAAGGWYARRRFIRS